MTQESRKSGVRCQKTDDGCRKFKKDFQTDDVKKLEEIYKQMRETREKVEKMKRESLAAVHTHTHTHTHK